jgi:hypothetical protein
MLPHEDYDIDHEPEWLRYASDHERRKFWGPNLWPMVIQIGAGLGIVYFLVWSGFTAMTDSFFYSLSCTYVTGSCL